MNAEIEVFDKVIAEFPCDTDWNESVPLEKAYAAADLKRYNLDNLWQTYAQVSFEEKDEEQLTATKGATSSNTSGLTIVDGNVAPDAASVKKEYPLADMLKEQIPFLKSGKGWLVTLFRNFMSQFVPFCSCKCGPQALWRSWSVKHLILFVFCPMDKTNLTRPLFIRLSSSVIPLLPLTKLLVT